MIFPLGELRAQTLNGCSGAKTALQGQVRNSHGTAVANANVDLRFTGEPKAASTKTRLTRTDTTGSFCFPDLPIGSYSLRATLNGYRDTPTAAISLTQSGMTIDLLLVETASAQKPDSPFDSNETISKAPEFFDQPQFVVAGVTQAASGGHGADTVGRSTEALARKMKSLATDSPAKEPNDLDTERKTLTSTVAREPENAEAHRLLGNVQEKLDNPLEAVREYQRAAEIDPSEPNLFSWGAELLAHRALEPATEVLEKGNHSYPQSKRMIIALGVAWYSRGFYDRAAQALVSACDLDSGNPTPYLFLGEMQAAQVGPLPGSTERLARFAQLQPGNALANYYYAVSLLKQLKGHEISGVPNPDSSRDQQIIESLLKKVVRLDPQLGMAHLQLGIFYSNQGDSPAAMREFREAIRVALNDRETLADAHYRLAQAYVRSGDRTKAEEEFRLHRDVAKQNADVTARERQKLQQFVMSLRDKSSSPDATSAKH